MSSPSSAILALADGSIFRGISIGADGSTAGEVVFNTAMTGYQEILTDPSYCRQIVTLTYPHIGNTGVNAEDVESGNARIHAAGLVIRNLPMVVSNFRSEQNLADYLRAENVVGIAEIDTRRLTRILREKGAQSGCILAGAPGAVLGAADEAAALKQARGFAGLNGMDLAKVVSVTQPYAWDETEWVLGAGHDGASDSAASSSTSSGTSGGTSSGTSSGTSGTGYGRRSAAKFKVVAYDFGVKRNILRMLASRGCDLTVVPAQTPASEVFKLKPDGVFLSNGPGDQEPCDYAIAAVRDIIASGTPVFGICLGHQIMGLASGAKTHKMKFGHHGANHPVKDLQTGQVVITSQNHGFAVDPNSMPSNLEVTHVSLFDGSIQGLKRKDQPAFCFQGHPEASPGPHDIGYLFDRFTALMIHRAKEKAHA